MTEFADLELKAVWEFIESGKLEQADSACRRLISDHPSLVEANFPMGIIRYRKGDNTEALRHLQLYLEHFPDAVEALGLTAQLLLECGHHEEALELGRRAHQLRPDEGPILLLHLSGKSHLAENEPLSALRDFHQLVQLNPKHPAGYLGAAEAYLALGSSFDAVEIYETVLKIAPSKAVLLKLAILELKLGRPERAFAAASRVLSREPNDPTANGLVGQSLVEQDRAEESDVYWQRAEANATERYSLDLKRGSSLSMMGDFEQGEVFLRRSINAKPIQGSAYHLVFANRKAKADDADLIDQMQAALADQALAPTERAALAFALGKAADDMGDPERAFAYYDEGHAIQKALLDKPFDPSRLTEQFRIQQELFSRPATIQNEEMMQPIFVLGMLRSGTTLTEQILSAHAQVVGAGELDFWTGSENLLIDRLGPAFNEEAAKERKGTYRRILDSFGGGTKRVVDKYPGNLNVVGMIHHIYPKAHILYLRRNPVDIAISLWATHSNPFSPFTVTRESVAFAIRQSIVQAEYWSQVLPKNRFLEIRYEKLVEDPESEIGRILNFCELPWEDACLHASESKKKVRTPSLWQVRQPVYRTSVDRWKKYEPWLGEFASLLS